MTAKGDQKSEELQEGIIHDEFKEVDEVKGIISSLSSIFGDSIAVELAVERCLCECLSHRLTPSLF